MSKGRNNLKYCVLKYCLLFCLASAAIAADWKSLKPQGYVSDFAGVVDAPSRAAIEDYAARVQQATGAQLAFVVLPSLQNEPIEDVANDIFHAWGVGQRKEDNGAMVLLSVGDRKSRLEVGGGLGEAVPDSMAGLLLDDMRPALREGNYGAALLAAAERLGGTIAKAKGVAIAAPQGEVRRVQPSPRDSIPWPLIFLGLFFLLVLLRRGGNGGGRGRLGGGGGGFWSGMLLGQMLNSGRGWAGGGRDGGGFGGYDSGGSGGGFGGFGGGDSGGGGASSDW
jgi:uncharacterized protein